jgi:hypothetical protein
VAGGGWWRGNGPSSFHHPLCDAHQVHPSSEIARRQVLAIYHLVGAAGTSMGATASRPGAAAGSGDSANTRGNGGPVASIKFGALGGGDGAADTPLRREFQPFAGCKS